MKLIIKFILWMFSIIILSPFILLGLIISFFWTGILWGIETTNDFFEWMKE